jgi:hypothetical protein
MEKGNICWALWAKSSKGIGKLVFEFLVAGLNGFKKDI